MARPSLVTAFMTVALMFSCASANTLWMPVQVVDCENRPVVGVKIALWNCVDNSTGNVAALIPAMSSVITTTAADGYVIGVQSPPPAGGCAGLSSHFCYGSAENPCKISVLNPDLSTNTAYSTEVLFGNYDKGVKEYVTKYVPQCLAKSFGALGACNNCGSDQYCYAVSTILRPSCCPRKCYCV